VTNPENLRHKDREALTHLRREFQALGKLWDQRERLRAIFADRTITTAEQGRERSEVWTAEVRTLGLASLEKFCKTLTNWMGQIANYIVSRRSNGRTEGLNHGLRTLLWRAWGMTNFQNFRLRVQDHFGLCEG
jgi:transposase